MESTADPALTVRTATLADAAAVAAIYEPVVRDTSISFELEPPAQQVMCERIQKTLPVYPWLVAECESGIVGYAYAGKHRERPAYRWAVEVSVYVCEKMRRRGIGRVLYRQLLLILQRQGFRSAFAGITLPNPSSVRLHEAVGFEPLGVFRDVGYKHGRWHDVGWWRLGLSAGGAPPTEPIPYSVLAASRAAG